MHISKTTIGMKETMIFYMYFPRYERGMMIKLSFQGQSYESAPCCPVVSLHKKLYSSCFNQNIKLCSDMITSV